jgi:acetylornithine/N-succinyldiaminopimelate aminotransferase
VRPDIVTCAKALGCGVPVGAFVLADKVAKASLVAGDHGTTYGGNPFVLAAVTEVFRLFEKHDIVGHVNAIAPYLEKKLDELMAAHPDKIKAHRGLGLMRGLELADGFPVGQVTMQALKEGMLVISAGSNVLRFVPPLIITEKEVDEAVAILEKCFA